MARKRAFVHLRGLPPEGLDYVHACFRQALVGAGPTNGEIVAQVAQRWGVKMPERMLSRYYAYWRSDLFPIEQAEEQAHTLLGTLRETPTEELETAIRQLLTSQRLLALRGLDGADPVDVAMLGVKADRVELERRKLALEQEKLALATRRLAAMETQVQKAKEAVDKVAAKKSLGPADLKEIRERIYGIAG